MEDTNININVNNTVEEQVDADAIMAEFDREADSE